MVRNAGSSLILWGEYVRKNDSHSDVGVRTSAVWGVTPGGLVTEFPLTFLLLFLYILVRK